MPKQITNQLWVKKRTSRGGGRAVKRSAQFSSKNISRDVHKNQLVYSRYLLKLTLLFALGLLWLRLGVQLGPLSALPIGAIIGLVIISSEPFRAFRKFEAVVLLASTIASFYMEIGVVM